MIIFNNDFMLRYDADNGVNAYDFNRELFKALAACLNLKHTNIAHSLEWGLLRVLPGDIVHLGAYQTKGGVYSG